MDDFSYIKAKLEVNTLAYNHTTTNIKVNTEEIPHPIQTKEINYDYVLFITTPHLNTFSFCLELTQNEEEDKAAEEDKKCKAAVPTTYQTKNRKPQPVEAVCV